MNLLSWLWIMITYIKDKTSFNQVFCLIIFFSILFNSVLKAQDSKNIYLKNGGILNANSIIGLDTDSVTILLKDGSILKLRTDEIHKINLESKENKQDSVKMDTEFFLGTRFLMSNFDPPRVFYQLELVPAFSFGKILDLGIRGGYSVYTNSLDLENRKYLFYTPLTKHATYNSSKLLLKDDFESILEKGTYNTKLFYLGFKAGYHIYGNKIKHYVNFGVNYYFTKEHYEIAYTSKDIIVERQINIFDSLTSSILVLYEPISVKTKINYSITRDQFWSYDISYALKFKVSSKIGIHLAFGLNYAKFLSKSNANFEYNIIYMKSNYYKDEEYMQINQPDDGYVSLPKVFVGFGIDLF